MKTSLSQTEAVALGKIYFSSSKRRVHLTQALITSTAAAGQSEINYSRGELPVKITRWRKSIALPVRTSFEALPD